MTESKIPLVLLPGLLNDARLWQQQSVALAGYADITVADLTRRDTIEALAQDVLEQAPAGRFALAGLSMGGYVALEIMRQAPERILALALLDTSARPDTGAAAEARVASIALAERDWPQVIEGLLPKLLHPSHLQNQALTDTLRAMADTLGPQIFVRQQRAIMQRIDSRPFLHMIACPTLVICGREDQITPLEVHEEIVVAVPGAQVAIIDHSGHLSALEQPLPVIAAMEKWLADLRKDAAQPQAGRGPDRAPTAA